MTYVRTLILGLFLGLSTQAQVSWDYSLEQDVDDLSKEIKQKASSITLDQRNQIASQIKAIRSILNQVRAQNDFACVSKSNDGRNPYMIAASNGVKMQKVAGTLYQKVDDCNFAIAAIRETPLNSLLCSSRDSDGKGPWIMGLLTTKATFIKIERAVSNTIADCQIMAQDLVLNDDQITGLYCSPKNGDGRSPYVLSKVDLSSGKMEMSSEIFGDLAKCKKNLGIQH